MQCDTMWCDVMLSDRICDLMCLMQCDAMWCHAMWCYVIEHGGMGNMSLYFSKGTALKPSKIASQLYVSCSRWDQVYICIDMRVNAICQNQYHNYFSECFEHNIVVPFSFPSMYKCVFIIPKHSLLCITNMSVFWILLCPPPSQMVISSVWEKWTTPRQHPWARIMS